MTLGERIAIARKQAGLSQEQLGEKLGVSRQAVSKWESDQANPDVAYVAEMCRLFGVSSDWLLLGRAEQGAAPSRCPACQAIVTGLDRYCPNCGRSLEGAPKEDRYTLLLKPPVSEGDASVDDSILLDLGRLSNSGLFPEDSPLHGPIHESEARALVQQAPLILARDLPREQIDAMLDVLFYQSCFPVYREVTGATAQELVRSGRPVPIIEKKEPMSFGATVGAVILGILAAVLILSFL